ncbi:MAG TPA: hypothetical protein PLU11_03665 [Chitinophagaceae bacterium]|nr:hypothetical protein [Chitinophagaceae bacterium]
MKRHFLYFIYFLFCLSIVVSSQSNFPAFENWKYSKVPTNPDTIYSYNLDNSNWIVYRKNDNIRVKEMMDISDREYLPFKTPTPISYSKMEEFTGKRSFIKVTDGYLVAFWRGEFGASLFWFSDDGTRYYKINGASAVQFIERNGEIYAINGLAHLDMSNGILFKIDRENNKWVANKYLELPFAPYAVSLDSNNDFIVVTSDNLIKINRKKRIKTLLKTDFWQGLYPTSSVIEGEYCYIGMRKGVYKFNLRTKDSDWLLPK